MAVRTPLIAPSPRWWSRALVEALGLVVAGGAFATLGHVVDGHLLLVDASAGLGRGWAFGWDLLALLCFVVAVLLAGRMGWWRLTAARVRLVDAGDHLSVRRGRRRVATVDWAEVMIVRCQAAEARPELSRVPGLLVLDVKDRHGHRVLTHDFLVRAEATRVSTEPLRLACAAHGVDFFLVYESPPTD